jgi:hypothetical protein
MLRSTFAIGVEGIKVGKWKVEVEWKMECVVGQTVRIGQKVSASILVPPQTYKRRKVDGFVLGFFSLDSRLQTIHEIREYRELSLHVHNDSDNASYR